MEMEQAPPNHIKDQIKETQGTNTQRERERESADLFIFQAD